MSSFDDPRSRESEETAFDAERLERAGKLEEARALCARAALLEEVVTADVPPSQPRIKMVLATSSIALWVRAAKFERALALVRHYIAIGAATEEDLAELAEQIRSRWVVPTEIGAPGQLDEMAQTYWDAREDVEWKRTRGGDDATQQGLSGLEQLWRKLSDKDLAAISFELMSIDASLDRTGEFLFEEPLPQDVADMGPRTGR